MSKIIYEATLIKIQEFRERASSIQTLAFAVDAFRTNADTEPYASAVEDIYFLIEDINADCADKARQLTAAERANIEVRLESLKDIIQTLKHAADSRDEE